jgi:hypothetical protein
MKSAMLLSALSLLALPVHAIEYVTLTSTTASRTLNATDLVEVVGTNKNNYGTSDNLILTFADGSTTAMLVRGKENGASFSDMKGNIFTGLTNIALQVDGSTGNLNKPCLTLKITPAEEVGVTPAGAVLVFPENTSGDFNLVIESSDDLVNWNVFSSNLLDVSTARRFYRTRIIKVEAP